MALIKEYSDRICSGNMNFKDAISFVTLCEKVICDELSWCGDEYMFSCPEATAGMEGLKAILLANDDKDVLKQIQETEETIRKGMPGTSKSPGAYKIYKQWSRQYKKVFTLAIEKAWKYLEGWGFPLKSVLFDEPGEKLD